MNAVTAFLLAFPALFSIVNPPGAAFIFSEVTAELGGRARRRLSARVGLYSLLVMLVALWGGSYLLNFFGISLPALRIGGGFVVAGRAFEMLNAPERTEARKTEQAGAPTEAMDSLAFFPLTMPFTTGPGTIAVAVALGAERPLGDAGWVNFFLGVSAAAVAVAALVWLLYRVADRITDWMGAAARRTLARLTAFLLLCIGVQILLTGIEQAIRSYNGSVAF